MSDIHDGADGFGRPHRPPGREQIRAWLVATIAERLGTAPDSVDTQSPFAGFGLSSREAMSLSGRLEEWLGRPVAPTACWDHPTVDQLATHLAADQSQPPAIGRAREPYGEPIAVIGIGCRFPGASGPADFWQRLIAGTDAITEVPPDRFPLDDVFDPDPATPGTVVTRWGGFLADVDRFDAAFFGISTREASAMDPQQRLMLEMAWEALEDAGLPAEGLAGTKTGVFVGISTNDYGRRQFSDRRLIDAYAGTGNALSIAANRVSYQFDFVGPSVAIDTACSSSLVAVHLACRSLWSGDATLALAGGVNLILAPDITINFTKAGVMAPDGRCKAFDARADGYVRGEGAALVVLKPLSRARADHDRIYAVLLGSAVNNDGRTNGLMAPSRQAQEAVLRDAYACAGVSPGAVQYVEAHGTGTLLGDPIEIMALGSVLAADRAPGDRCAVGSVKTNIGHLEAAAGAAGLVKVALALRHGAIPPSLHFERPNPHIPFADLPLQVQRSLSDWPGHGPRIAGTSAFGFGGTNAHVVLCEAPPPAAVRAEAARHDAGAVPVSARSPAALTAAVLALRDFLGTRAAENASLGDIGHAAAVRRSHHRYRVAVAGRSVHEIAGRLTDLLDGWASSTPALAPTDPRRGVVFVFPGQGAQWLGMGRGLLEREAVFRASLEECDGALRRHVDWSLLERIAGRDEAVRFDDIGVVQPVLFAIQVALAAQWRSWGIEPSLVVGHSMGEIAAACVAGALSLDDAARIVCERSRLLRTVRGHGRMAVVELPLDEAARVTAPYADRLAMAVETSPRSTVISGDGQALDALIETLVRQGVFCRLVNVDVASHSPQMDPLLDELRGRLAALRPRFATTPFWSTVTGAASNGVDLDNEYWARNLREPVRFSTVIQRLLADEHVTFLEISPQPMLLGAIRQAAESAGRSVTTLPSLLRDADERMALLDSLSALYTLGHDVAWSTLFPRGRHVALPAYPWQRERCWFEIDPSGPVGGVRVRSEGRRPHPLLNRYHRSADDRKTHCWEADVSPQSHAFLADHRVQGQCVVPATVYLEMACAATADLFGDRCTLVDVEFVAARILREPDVTVTLQLAVEEDPDGGSFRLSSRRQADNDSSWTLHATGRIRKSRGADEGSASPIDVRAIQAACADEIDGEHYYSDLRAAAGLDYGPRHRGIERIWRRHGEAVGEIRLAAGLETEVGAYRVHPAILDAALQVVGATRPELSGGHDGSAVHLPVRIGAFRVLAQPAARLWSVAAQRDGDAAPLTADVRLVAENGQVVAELRSLELRRVDGVAPGRPPSLDDWFYEPRWHHQPRGDATRPAHAVAHGRWILFTDRGDVAERLACLIEAQGDSVVRVRPDASRVANPTDAWEVRPEDPGDARRLLAEVMAPGQAECRGIVHAWNLDTHLSPDADCDDLDASRLLGCTSVLHVVQALAGLEAARPPRLFVLTRHAQAVRAGDPPVSLAQAPVWGLARTVALEHPELRTTCIDLGDAGAEELAALHRELTVPDHEDQLALRDGQRYVPRLASVPGEEFPLASSSPFKLEVARAGVIDRPAVRTLARRPPGPGEVEIEVAVAGLNFMDVMRTLGLVPAPGDAPLWVGAECAGHVAAVGAGVDNLRPGDAVVAIAEGTCASFVTTAAALVVGKPAHLSAEEAATIPVAFLTAAYALHHVARLRRGERVLIHAAAGGVGLAAVQLALARGAVVLATAGSPDKRAFVHSLGVEHVFDSRSTGFADGVMTVTHGEGVDVVLNSLSGTQAARSLSLLRAGGRFLEIGKRDIHENQPLHLGPFGKNLAYFAIDLQQLCVERPTLAGALLRRLMRRFSNGSLQPLPYHTFALSAAADALRFMAQARHMGKIVLTMPARGSAPPQERALPVRSDATYLITGGLGDLGLAVARWMIEHGARHLVLTGRHRPSAAAVGAIAVLRQAADVRIVQADVTDRPQMAALLRAIDEPGAGDGGLANGPLPPLRGVVHAAGSLDDGVVAQLDAAHLASVARPKVEGGWNLHTLTRDRPLDCFVLFSSAASILGSPGQANYAAANAFLDALAQHRHQCGLPALAINWGPWGDIGLAARRGRADRLAMHGIGTIAPEDGLEAFGRLLHSCRRPQVAVVPIDRGRLDPRSTALPILALVAPGQSAVVTPPARRGGSAIREAVLRASADKRVALLQSFISDQLARVLWLSPSAIDVHRPLNTYGVDSLMAIELRNRVERELGVRLPIAVLLQGPDVVQLAGHLAEQCSSDVVAATAAAGAAAWPAIVPDPDSRSLPFPLNDIQGAYWVGRSTAFELGNVGSHFYLEFEGPDLDLARLENGWQQLMARHEMLRAIVRPDGQQQVLATVPAWTLGVTDLRREAEADAAAHSAAVRERMAHQVYDPARWPLFEIRATRLPQARTRVHVSIDLLIADVWSLFLLFREWGALYANPHARLPALTLTFRDYVLAEAAARATPAHARAEAYWAARLPLLPPGPALPLACAPAALTQPRFVRRSARLEAAGWQALKRRAQQHGVTPSMALCAVFAEVLAAWSRTPHFTLNLTLFHRQPLHPEVTAIVGDFTSTVLLAVDTTAADNLTGRARQLQRQLSADLEHRDVSGVRVLRDLARQTGSGPGATMPVVFTSTLGNEGGGTLAPTAWLGAMVFGISQTPQVWLDHQVGEDGDALVFNWDAVEALFPTGLLDAMFGAYCTRLASVGADDAMWSVGGPALLPEDQRRARNAANASAWPVPAVTLPELVAAQVALQPMAAAVITPSRALTYAELNDRTGAIAHWLRAHGAQRNHLVAVVMEKGWEQVVAVVGIVRAGAAYLPIESDVPADRLGRLLAQGETTLVLTQSWLIGTLAWPPGLTLLAVDAVDPQVEAGDDPADAAGPDDLAYVIFTSGSTGVPKGVMLTHRAVVNTLLDLNARWNVGPADRVLALSALSFDLSVYDIFGTLAAGGAVVLPARDARRDPVRWLERLREDTITVWNTVPALMQLLVEAAAAAGTGLPESLRLVLLSGDWIPVRLPDRIRALAPDVQVVSLGGATEAAIWSIYYPIDVVDHAWPSIPYGRPLANQTWHVLHADWTPCPVWVPGELYIGGAGLAHGYWRDPERTRERFVMHPTTGETLYRTGDWGRYRPDGDIEFLGRDDLQVKVQGYRIELGEIEAALLQQPGVSQAAVAAHGERTGDKRLAAYIVGRDGTPPDVAAVRGALQSTLPSYMVPSRFHVLATLPLTANGKVDRAALSALETTREAVVHADAITAASVSMKNADDAGAASLAERIEQLVAGVLKVDHVERDANFLSLGLTSIDIMRLANSLEQTFGFRPQMADLFTLTDVSALTSYYATRIARQDQEPHSPSGHVILDPDQRESFTLKRPGLRQFDRPGAVVRLPKAAAPAMGGAERRSHRQYGADPMALGDLAALLECLAEQNADGQLRRRYGSAGALYAVQAYLHVRPGRVDGLAAGTYYYHPVAHGLLPLAPAVDLSGAVHVTINRPVFEQAAFSIFLVGHMGAILPVYGERARDFALLEAGLITQLLETSAAAQRIGLCQIGLIDFDAVRDLFQLEESHLFLHALLGGPVAHDGGDWEEGAL